MTVAPDSHGEDEPDTEDDSNGEEPNVSPDAGLDPDVVRSVEAFRSLQRHIAGIDLSVVRAAQRAIASSLSSVNVPAIVAAQDAIARNIARSIDFSGLQAAASNALIASTDLTSLAEVQQRWARAFASSIDLSALHSANEALVSSAALGAVREAQASWAETFARQVDFSALADKLALALPKMDVGRWLELLQRWIPINLREAGSLDAVAQLALDEGLPLTWVPRPEIVEALLAADGVDERVAILDDRFTDISMTAKRRLSTSSTSGHANVSPPSRPCGLALTVRRNRTEQTSSTASSCD